MESKLTQVCHYFLQRQTYTLSSVQSPDQILAQSSEVCLGKSGFLSASTFSNKFPVDNALTPEVAPVGSMRNKYISKPYSFAGNSGSPRLSFYYSCIYESFSLSLPSNSEYELS